MTEATSPAIEWARERRPRRGPHWEALEARVFADHVDVQLLLRVRGLVLPRKGAWYLAAFACSAAAALAAFGLGSVDAQAGRLAAGALMVAVAVLQVVGFAWALQGYGTGADAFWGLVVFFTGAVPVAGLGMLEAEAGSGGPSFLFWFALVAIALGLTGSAGSTLTPSKGGARSRRVLAAVAALPEAERERIGADLAAALDVLVERRVIDARTRKEALGAPLGGLAVSRQSGSAS
ncbi:hypothetical protein [Glycomyces paridis]|uniref:Uncharacterized protein n=1 Tax=Glycomyces paridis TaxID=2126555 RepID=A0A4S8PEH9_9ACTN|nr:hypothetical protein [Glycomyces paridis]THV26754.1 hypothetical protein E9998_17355 [Glycomyces paridis]